MKVKEMIEILRKQDQDAEVVIAGYETMYSIVVAQADLVKTCKTVSCEPVHLEGNRKLSSQGESSVWIGCSEDYRTQAHLEAIDDPESMLDKG